MDYDLTPPSNRIGDDFCEECGKKISDDFMLETEEVLTLCISCSHHRELINKFDDVLSELRYISENLSDLLKDI